MSTKRLQIFRIGKHTAADGKSYEFSEAALRAAVAAYDPAVHEAPIVVGHPATDHPAYGWIRGLHFSSDGAIEADTQQVNPEFAEMVSAGSFKKISSAWYLPDAPGNPTPGKLYLRHVGFLGAEPPAIKGLKSASFSSSAVGVVEFAEWQTTTLVSMFRRLREWLIGDRGLEVADTVLPDWQIKSLEESGNPMPAYSEPPIKTEKSTMDAAELARRAADLDRREAGIKDRETQLSAQQRTQLNATNAAFAEQLVQAGRVLPVHRIGLVAFLDSLANAGTIEFSEAGKTTKAATLDWFKSYLQAQPKVVHFGEVAGDERVAPVDLDNSQQLAAAAVQFQESEKAKGRVVSVAQAIQHIQKLQADT